MLMGSNTAFPTILRNNVCGYCTAIPPVIPLLSQQNQSLAFITDGYARILLAHECIPLKYLLTTPQPVPIVP
jgi:hypothetical protein